MLGPFCKTRKHHPDDKHPGEHTLPHQCKHAKPAWPSFLAQVTRQEQAEDHGTPYQWRQIESQAQ